MASPGDDKTVKSLLGEWAGNTGMHGLPNITRTHSKPKKMLWIVVMLFGIGFLTYMVYTVIAKFYSYPTNIEKTSKVYLPSEFPAVTVCNINPVRRIMMEKTMKSDFVAKNEPWVTTTSNTPGPSPVTVPPSAAGPATTAAGPPTTAAGPATTTAGPATTAAGPATTAAGPATTTAGPATTTAGPATTAPPGRKKRDANFEVINNANNDKLSRVKRSGDHRPPPSTFNALLSNTFSGTEVRNLSAMSATAIPDSLGSTYRFFDYYNSMTNSWKKEIGYQIEDFLVDCTFSKRYCSAKDFKYFLHPLYGNCYTFNANVNTSEFKSTLEVGHLHGLTATFWIDQTEYVGNVAVAAGIRLVVHDRTKMPFPEETGINLPAGMFSNVAVKRIKVHRLPFPYEDNCENDNVVSNEKLSLYSVPSVVSLPNLDYSQTACRKTCTQRKIEEACNCSSPNLPISNPLVDPIYSDKYRFCFYRYNSVYNNISESATCMLEYEMKLFKECKEMCKIDCDENIYKLSTSMLTWPSQASEKDSMYQIMMYNENIRKKFNSISGNDKPTYLGQNFVKFNLYYDDFNTEHITSTEGYSMIDMVSDMGGQVGLWLGLSVLTIFELVEVIIDLIILLTTRKSRKIKDTWKVSAVQTLKNEKFKNLPKSDFLTEKKLAV